MRGAVPAAVTVKVAVCPALTVWLTGCAVMDGGAFTVNMAALLVMLPVLPVTVTVNEAPLSEPAVTGVV